MNIANLKVSQRLALGFGMLIALLAIIAAVGVTRMTQLAAQIDEVVNDRYEKTALLSEMQNQINLQARAVRNMLLLTDPAEVKAEQSAASKRRQNSAKASPRWKRKSARRKAGNC